MEKIRRSHLNDFERCPRLFWYINEQGIEVKPEASPVVQRCGSYLHSLVAGSEEQIYFSDVEEREKRQVEVIYDCMVELDLIPEVHHEVFFQREITSTISVEGTLDMVKGNWFGEMKYTTKPDYYLHTFSAQAQLEFYFFISGLEVASILPVRQPALRYMEGKEDVDKFLGRLKEDVLRRPSYYFPHYDPDKQPRWGLKFYRSEFDMDEVERRLRWWFKEIKKCREFDYWPQRKQNCLAPFECSYLSLCESGAFNEAIYTIRKK